MHPRLQTGRQRQHPANPGEEGLCGHEVDPVYGQ